MQHMQQEQQRPELGPEDVQEYHGEEQQGHVEQQEHVDIPEEELRSQLDSGLRPEELIAQLLSEEQAQALLALVQHAQQQQEDQDHILPPQDQESSHIQELLDNEDGQIHHHPQEEEEQDHRHALQLLDQHHQEQHHEGGEEDGQVSQLETEKLTAALQSAVQSLVHESLSSQQVAELESALPQALFQSLALQLCQAALQGSYNNEMGSEGEALISALLGAASKEEGIHENTTASQGPSPELLIEEAHARLQQSVEAGQEMTLEQLQHTLQVLTSVGTLTGEGDGNSGHTENNEIHPSSPEYWTSALNAIGLGVSPPAGAQASLPQGPVSNASDFVVVQQPTKTVKDRPRPIGPLKRPEKRPRIGGDSLKEISSPLGPRPPFERLGFHRPIGASHGGDHALEQVSEEATEEERLIVREAVSKATQVLNKETGKTETTYTCPKCTSSFTRIYNLKSHVRSHQNFRPFKCSSCSATFSRNHDLTRHEKIHNQAKPFSCKFCGKTFSRKDALRRHEKMDLQGKKTHCIVPSAVPSKLTSPIGTGAVIHLGDLRRPLNIPSVLHQSHPTQQHHSHHHSTPSPSSSLPSRTVQTTPLTPSIEPPATTQQQQQEPQPPPTPLSPSILRAATSLFTDISPAELEIHVKQLQELKKQMDQLDQIEALKSDVVDLTEEMSGLNEGAGGEMNVEHSHDIESMDHSPTSLAVPSQDSA